MNLISIGIDPGNDGAIVVLHNDRVILHKHVMPTIGTSSRQLDIPEIVKTLRWIKETYKNYQLIVILEKVHAKFGSAAKATFNFGYGCGVLEAVVVALELPYLMVQPKEWQKELWAGVTKVTKASSSGKTKVTDTKATSLIAARRLWPSEDFTKSERSKKDHDGIVDAVLMAEYGLRKRG